MEDEAVTLARMKLEAFQQYRHHRLYGDSSMTSNGKPPADFSAHGKEGAKVKRAAVQQRMTATERRAYRSGYQAGNKQRQRWLEACQRVLRSLVSEG